VPQTLTVVGYGSNDRRFAEVTIRKIDTGMITLLNNSNATGQGGACGDGGSPYFLGDSNVAVGVADGETGRCNAISWRSGTTRRRRGPSSTISSASRRSQQTNGATRS
jgi:hypothetical protein